MAELGFTNMKYRTADLVLDGGIGGNCPASTTYFLNTDYLFSIRPMAGYDVTTMKTGGERVPYNQDGILRDHRLQGQYDDVECPTSGCSQAESGET
jgi:hypothetical protein